MSIQTRKERERAEREQLIISAARELAETEGWEAVTTRRLAEKVDYSQPVLYSHFKGKTAIMTAVAMEGFTELADQLQTAANAEGSALVNVGRAYLAYAEQRPALYDAMFSLHLDLPFATPEAPAALHASFNALAQAVTPRPGEDIGLLTETFWSALHGLATLTRGGRLPAPHQDQRLTLLLTRFSA